LQVWRSEKAKIVHGTQVVNALLDTFSSASNMLNICGNSKFLPQLLSLEITKETIAAKNSRIRQRYLVEVVKDNIPSCRNLMKIVAHQNDSNLFRHSDEVEANFVVSEKEYLGSITLKEPHQQAIYSNMKDMVEQQHHIFESLWNKAIPIQDRIAEIEEGIEHEFYEVINDYKKAQEKYINLARSVDREALLLCANSKAMVRAYRLGVIDSLIEASVKKGAIIRIVCPLAEENSEIVARISKRAPDIRILNYNNNNNASPHSGLLVVDRAKFMRFELKEPKAEEFSEAIGFVIFSNNKASVESSKSFFELLWNERIQQEKLKEYEKLKEADKMKTDFINVAAHELRTPIQPIVGLTQVLRSGRLDDEQYNEFLDVIYRNAKRLQQLADDILDVTKIESHNLTLKIAHVSINGLISNALLDFKEIIMKKDDGKLSLAYVEPKQDIFVEVDKYRLRQVIANLLSNAIKFTNDGTIVVTAEERKYGNSNNNGREIAIISIKDTGAGIDSEILPKLFSKFASKSFQGTGLGLFISKSIIEAHGGRIWAENNADGKGATFSFTLPLHEITVSY
jgi:two-component system, OmpR family, sensor histidine kinase VicK